LGRSSNWRRVQNTDFFTANLGRRLTGYSRSHISAFTSRNTLGECPAVLRQTYQARLDQAAGEADQVWNATEIMQSQLREVGGRLEVLRKNAVAVKKGFEQMNVSAALYVNIESTLLTTEADEIQLRASLGTAQSALETLLGLPFGTAADTK
jgi:hypothetical protein